VNQPGKGLRNVKVIGEIDGFLCNCIDKAGVEDSPGAAPPVIRFGREEGA